MRGGADDCNGAMWALRDGLTCTFAAGGWRMAMRAPRRPRRFFKGTARSPHPTSSDQLKSPDELASLLVCQHVNLQHLVRLERRFAAGNLVHVFHAFDHFTPQGVLSRELTAGCAKADEKLAVGAVGIARGGRHAAAALILLA